MNEAIIVEIIGALAIIIAQILSNLRTQAEVRKGQHTFNAVTEEKFKSIEKKFDTVNKKLELHNGYAEKFPRMEARLEYLEKSVDEIKDKL